MIQTKVRTGYEPIPLGQLFKGYWKAPHWIEEDRRYRGVNTAPSHVLNMTSFDFALADAQGDTRAVVSHAGGYLSQVRYYAVNNDREYLEVPFRSYTTIAKGTMVILYDSASNVLLVRYTDHEGRP